MTPHWHASVDQILLYGLSALVVMNLLRLVAVPMVNSNQPLVKNVGAGLGALVTFAPGK